MNSSDVASSSGSDVSTVPLSASTSSTVSPPSFNSKKFDGDIVVDLETTGLTPLVDRIVSIGVKSADFERVFLNVDERQLLLDFVEFLAGVRSPWLTRLVGFNFGFDFSFLKIRCVVHKVFLPFRRTLDLRFVLVYPNYGMKGKLGDFKRLFGVVDDDESDGSKIPKLWEAGDL
ncbi:MAG TPA: hypothetical protein ENH95_02755, partial [Nitrosopumilus sp.]|nr:hypothetical protein [Nitrosopumilus sp.]